MRHACSPSAWPGVARLLFLVALVCPGPAPTADLARGVNYLTLWHGYSPAWTPDELIGRDFDRFRADGITHLALTLYWYRLEGPTPGDFSGQNRRGEPYGDPFLDGVAHVIDLAAERDLQVQVSFQTLWGKRDSAWCTPEYVREFRRDEETGHYREVSDQHGYGLSIIHDRSGRTKQQFLAAVTHAVDRLAGREGIWSWSLLNEPWAWPKDDWKRESFLTLFEQLAAIVRARDARPVTIRFVNAHHHVDDEGKTHVSDIFYDDFRSDPRLFQALDFIGFNFYAPYPADDEDDEQAWRKTLEILREHVALCRRHDKPVWITEFGRGTDDDQAQAEFVRWAMGHFQELGIKGCMAWAWHGDWARWSPKNNGCGSMNLVADPATGRPRPAYDVLAAPWTR
ncbi:MAG: cellulase family glycosylhydrolase [Armatimonadota bacterium]